MKKQKTTDSSQHEIDAWCQGVREGKYLPIQFYQRGTNSYIFLIYQNCFDNDNSNQIKILKWTFGKHAINEYNAYKTLQFANEECKKLFVKIYNIDGTLSSTSQNLTLHDIIKYYFPRYDDDTIALMVKELWNKMKSDFNIPALKSQITQNVFLARKMMFKPTYKSRVFELEKYDGDLDDTFGVDKNTFENSAFYKKLIKCIDDLELNKNRNNKRGIEVNRRNVLYKGNSNDEENWVMADLG